MDKWLKIGLGVGLLWYGVLRGASAIVVKVQDYMLRTFNIQNKTVSVSINFYIKNPLFVGVTLNNIVGDVYIQGVNVGAVNQDLNYFIAGGKTHIIPVIVDLQLSSLSEAVWRNIESGDVHTLTVDFDGKLYVGKYNVGVPVEVNLDYNDLFKR